MSNVLFVAPHPDDETLGCGGTILKHRANEDKIYCLIMTNISVEDGYNDTKVTTRQQEIGAVVQEYGFEKLYKLDYPTTKLDVIPRNKLIKSVCSVINEVKPSIIYLPNRNDVHSDHKITFDAVISSAKTFRYPFIKRVLMYETLSETEYSPPFQCSTFVPNTFSDITEYMNKKLSIIKIYKDELAEHPFPRSIGNITALATFRGATAGVRYAEAFMILKEIW